MATPSRRENDSVQIDLAISRHHEQVTATSTLHIFKARRPSLVDRVEYANPTGLVGAAGNAFKGEVKNGATVVSTVFNTDTGAGGATLGTGIIVATPGGSPALANRLLAAGDVLDLVLTEVGIATLPPGDLLVYVREV